MKTLASDSSVLEWQGVCSSGSSWCCFAHHGGVTSQADLKDLDKGNGLSTEAVKELCHTTDLALHATKQTAAAIGRSMVVMVATERHLWINLLAIGKKEKDGCGEVQGGEGTNGSLRKFIPLCSKSSSKEDDRTRAEAHRQNQKSSICFMCKL